VLEIGTSNGYSTLWLAGAARAIGGSVTTVEKSAYKIDLSGTNFARSGLASYISALFESYVTDRFFLQKETDCFHLCVATPKERRAIRWARSHWNYAWFFRYQNRD
jgi:predicted O-methyltransferase YrrM